MFSDVKGEWLKSDYEKYPDLRSSLLHYHKTLSEALKLIIESITKVSCLSVYWIVKMSG
jgi:hypothetical protein